MKKKEIFLVIVLIAFGLSYQGLHDGLRGCRVNIGDTTSLETDVYTDFPQPTQTFAGITSVDFINAAGQVDINLAADDRVTVSAVARVYHEDRAEAGRIAKELKLRVANNNGRLEVYVPREDFPYRRMRVHFTLRLPVGVALSASNRYGYMNLQDVGKDVKLDQAYGNLTVVGVPSGLSVTQKYGDADIRNLSGHLYLHSAYSSVRVENVPSLRLEGKHSDGDIRHVKGAVAINDSYGDIELDDAGQVEIDGPHTSILVRNVRGGVTIRNTYEPIQVQQCFGEISLNGHHSPITLTDIDTPRLKVENTYNDLRIENFRGKELDVNLHHGDLELMIAQCSERMNIEGNYMNVDLKYPANMKPTFSLRTYNGSFTNDTTQAISVVKERAEVTASSTAAKPTISINTRYGDILLGHVGEPPAAPVPPEAPVTPKSPKAEQAVPAEKLPEKHNP